MADWLEYHSERAQVWVSLDQADNDPARLWLHVVEGIRDEIVDSGLSQAAYGGGFVDIDRVVDEVVIALGESEEDVILVLDDVHVIEDPTALRSLDRVLASLPPNVSPSSSSPTSVRVPHVWLGVGWRFVTTRPSPASSAVTCSGSG